MSASCILHRHKDCVVVFFPQRFFICKKGLSMKGYINIKEASKKWNIRERRITTLCLEGRILNAEKFGNVWAIPEDAEKPNDERIKSGKYVKQQ